MNPAPPAASGPPLATASGLGCNSPHPLTSDKRARKTPEPAIHGEKAAYFKDLGVTAVELMPVHEKPLDGGYWGYQTLSFFIPEISYAAFPELGSDATLDVDEVVLMESELKPTGSVYTVVERLALA